MYCKTFQISKEKHQNWIFFNACTTVVSQSNALEQSKQECSDRVWETNSVNEKKNVWEPDTNIDKLLTLFLFPQDLIGSHFFLSLFTMLHKKYFLFLPRWRNWRKKYSQWGEIYSKRVIEIKLNIYWDTS